MFNKPNNTVYLSPDTGQFDIAAGQGNIQGDLYDNLGELIHQNDRSGATHTYTYNAVGQELTDAAAAFVTQGSGPTRMNASTTELSYSYDVLGRLVDARTLSNGVVQTDDLRVYDSLGNLINEYQEHFGVVNKGASPDVQYDYDTNFEDNYSRLASITYPNGRIVLYDYSGNAGLDSAISRLSGIIDGSGSDANGTLESYTYLGLGTVVTDTLPQVNAELSLTDNTSGESSNHYIGLDNFGRVIDQDWFTIGGATLDRNQYGYDADSNVLYDRNLGPTTQLQSLSELYGPYNALDQMTGFNIGNLNAAGTALDSAAWTAESFGQNASGVFQRNDANAPVEPTFQGLFNDRAT